MDPEDYGQSTLDQMNDQYTQHTSQPDEYATGTLDAMNNQATKGPGQLPATANDPFSQADQLFLNRLQTGMQAIQRQSMAGSITGGLANHLIGRIKSQMQPLLQKQQQTKQQQQEQAHQAALQAQATRKSVEHVGKVYDAQHFPETVATYTDPKTLKTAQVFQEKPGHWKEMRFEEENAQDDRKHEMAKLALENMRADKDRNADMLTAPQGGPIENYSPFAGMETGAVGEEDRPLNQAAPEEDQPLNQATPEEDQPLGGQQGGQQQEQSGQGVPPPAPMPKFELPPPLDPNAIGEMWKRADSMVPQAQGRGPGGRFLNPRMAQRAMTQRQHSVMGVFQQMMREHHDDRMYQARANFAAQHQAWELGEHQRREAAKAQAAQVAQQAREKLQGTKEEHVGYKELKDHFDEINREEKDFYGRVDKVRSSDKLTDEQKDKILTDIAGEKPAWLNEKDIPAARIAEAKRRYGMMQGKQQPAQTQTASQPTQPTAQDQAKQAVANTAQKFQNWHQGPTPTKQAAVPEEGVDKGAQLKAIYDSLPPSPSMWAETLWKTNPVPLQARFLLENAIKQGRGFTEAEAKQYKGLLPYVKDREVKERMLEAVKE